MDCESYYKTIYCHSFVFIALTAIIIILLIKIIRCIIFESISFAKEYSNIIIDQNNCGTKSTKWTHQYEKLVLYGNCAFINCNLMCFIACICSVHIIYQGTYYLYMPNIFIFDQFFVIMIILIVYALMFECSGTQTMDYQLLMINCVGLITISIVWFSTAIMESKLASLLVILCNILLYPAICINNNRCYAQDSKINMQGKMVLLSMIIEIVDTSLLLQQLQHMYRC